MFITQCSAQNSMLRMLYHVEITCRSICRSSITEQETAKLRTHLQQSALQVQELELISKTAQVGT